MREALLAKVQDLAVEATTADEPLLANALMGILLVSRLPFSAKRSILNAILALLEPWIKITDPSTKAAA